MEEEGKSTMKRWLLRKESEQCGAWVGPRRGLIDSQGKRRRGLIDVIDSQEKKHGLTSVCIARS